MRLGIFTALGLATFLFAQPGFAQADNVAGQRVYRSKCKSCHGAKGEGINAKLAVKKKLDPDKLSLAPMADKTDEESTKMIAEGKDKMPGFGEKLKPEQIKAVLAYCRTLVPEKKKAAGE